MRIDQREQSGDRAIPRRRRRSRCCGRLLAAALALCAVHAGARAGPADVSGRLVRLELDPPRPGPSCAPLSDDGERVSAIYLDLEIAPASDPPAPPIRDQGWFCAPSDLGVAFLASGADVAMDLASPDPSALSVILESSSGAIWEIELSRPDEAPLEPAAFASAHGGFFVNAIEWGEEAELAVLDADFEVDLANGVSLWGRVLWNAVWTPDEDPFVPLSDEDWKGALPGEVWIEGPALELLFRGTRDLQSNAWMNVQPGREPERVDSILYTEEPAQDPLSARIEVAEDVALLSASPAAEMAAPPRGASVRSAAPVAGRRSASAAARSGGAGEPRPLLPARSTSGSDPGSWAEPQRGEVTREPASAGSEDVPECAPDRASSEAPKNPPPGCATGVLEDEGEGSPGPTRGALGEDLPLPDPVQAGPDAAAFEEPTPGVGGGSGSAGGEPPGLEAGRAEARGNGGSSLEQRLEALWLAWHALVECWLHAIQGSALETRP